LIGLPLIALSGLLRDAGFTIPATMSSSQ